MKEESPQSRYTITIVSSFAFVTCFFVSFISGNNPSTALLKAAVGCLLIAILTKGFVYVFMMNVKDYFDHSQKELGSRSESAEEESNEEEANRL